MPRAYLWLSVLIASTARLAVTCPLLAGETARAEPGPLSIVEQLAAGAAPEGCTMDNKPHKPLPAALPPTDEAGEESDNPPSA